MHRNDNESFQLFYDLKGLGIKGEKTVLTCNNAGKVKGLMEGDYNVNFNPERISEDSGVSHITYKADGWFMSDNIKVLENGFFVVQRSWRNLTCETKDVVLLFEICTAFIPEFYLIPCVSYNGNLWGNGNEPKGLMHNDVPWVFSYERTGLPSATFSENSEYSVGIFVDKDRDSLVSSCSMQKVDGGMLHRIIWPDREEPVTYVAKNEYGPAIRNIIRLKPGSEFSTKLYICVSRVGERNTGWTNAYNKAANVFLGKNSSHETGHSLFSPEKVWELGIQYAKNSLLRKVENYTLFEMGLLPEGEHTVKAAPGLKWDYRKTERYEIGWCGQNISLACALINNFFINGDKESLQEGINVIDSWAENIRIGSGLFHVQFDNILASEDNSAGILNNGIVSISDKNCLKSDSLKASIEVDTCNLGWGAWQMLNAYEMAGKADLAKPIWYETGIGLCDFFVERLDTESLFGKTWSLDGICTDKGGTIGCFILPAIMKAFEITKDVRYLECCIKGFMGYSKRDLNRMECSAGALDTCCIDKESCWPLLKTGLDLFEVTGDEYYLKEALKAGYYLLSWMYHYNVIKNKECDFSLYKYTTQGATAVSTQHHHLDPWGSLICHDWLRLYRHTGDEMWKIRAQTTWNNSLLCLSDGSLYIHGMKRPVGSQNEAYFHCNWHFSSGNEKSRGSINDWLVSWPCAFRLVTLMRENDWSILNT